MRLVLVSARPARLAQVVVEGERERVQGLARPGAARRLHQLQLLLIVGGPRAAGGARPRHARHQRQRQQQAAREPAPELVAAPHVALVSVREPGAAWAPLEPQSVVSPWRRARNLRGSARLSCALARQIRFPDD